jgi:WD40 repeat protein
MQGMYFFSTLNGHTRTVNSVAFSPDNLRIASGSDDHSIKIWDAYSGSLLNTLNGHTDFVWSVAFSPDNSKIISGGHDKSIGVWDVHTGQLLNTLIGHTDPILCVAFSNPIIYPIDAKLKEHIKKLNK